MDTEGVAVIMTENYHVGKYQRELVMEELESGLEGGLEEAVNVEVALGNIRTVEKMVEYLKGTFYYVRLGQNKDRYRFEGDDNEKHAFITQKSQEILQTLLHLELISPIPPPATPSSLLRPLELSHELSKTSISLSTVRHLLLTLPTTLSLPSFLHTLSLSPELSKFPSKLSERKTLKHLNSLNKYKLK